MARRDKMLLHGDQWWEYKPFMSRDLRKEWLPKALDMLIYHEEAAPDDPGGGPWYALDPLRLADYMDLTCELVIALTTEWSFGEVSMEVLNQEVEPENLEAMIEEVAKFIPPLVPSDVNALLKAYSLP